MGGCGGGGLVLQYFEAPVGIIGVVCAYVCFLRPVNERHVTLGVSIDDFYRYLQCFLPFAFWRPCGVAPSPPGEHHELSLGSGVRVRGRVMSISHGERHRGGLGPQLMLIMLVRRFQHRERQFSIRFSAGPDTPCSMNRGFLSGLGFYDWVCQPTFRMSLRPFWVQGMPTSN